MIVLGSGGHTREMQSIVKDLDPRKYIHRTYIVSSGDHFSEAKARECEELMQFNSACTTASGVVRPAGIIDPVTGLWEVKIVSRARNVFQSIYNTPFSSLRCLIECAKVLHASSKYPLSAASEYPDVIITNGPGTGLIVVLASIVLKMLAMAPMSKLKIIFVESWARPNGLSLTGKILLWVGMCDRFIVQWEKQAETLNREGVWGRILYRDFMLGIQP